MIDLMECRRQIDVIDDELLRLFEKRMEIAEYVAKNKISMGKPVFDAVREEQKLKAFEEKAHGEFNSRGAKELLQQIMGISRKRQFQLLTENGVKAECSFRAVEKLPQENATVVFQGVEGAYSHAAMCAYFDDSIKSYHVKTWKDAMEEVSAGNADYAVLPIENSTAGIVADIYDLLMEYELCIVGEQIIRVDHVLLGTQNAELSDIETVFSHPQGLAQCQKYLEQYPQWKTVKMENTAGAAKKVGEELKKGQAAIASREAGELFGLKVLAENICHNGMNCTRFIIVGKEPVYEKDANHVSICMELPHSAGSLYSVLSNIIYNGLNMTKIESRPIPGHNWEYRFFVNFDGNLSDHAVISAIRGLDVEANRTRILGNYRLQED